ncbi:cation:proton antiporter [Fimbriiglobus ruber]|uniref:Na(+)/H(+) antiporter n=1 Tax=Fimbriiglobus ruber TaxID=1908690 RepID=A0A225D950_9BACT|nr:cation:proton antiporter [Fimbriiglobus ruber]OWK36174.1 Na(+)/H(+) antiporter [Fimbriiglobus ruber]
MLPFATVDPTVSADAVRALTKLHVEDLILPVLIQLGAIIFVARVFGALFRWLGQPGVVGEVVGGILMGPSLFGWLFPDLFAFVFRPDLPGVPDALTRAAFPKVFDVLAQIGLILLLFQIGLEFDFGHLKVKGRAAVLICVIGTAFPFALGVGLAPLVQGSLEPHPEKGPVPLFGLTLFLGTAMCITALPTLGRMMIEMGINRTRMATVVVTAAAVGDAIGWILLATVAALSASAYHPTETAKMVGLTVAFAAFMYLVVRPVLGRYFRKTLLKNQGQLSMNALAVLLVALLVCSIATNKIGIFAIFGAFLLGALLSDEPAFRAAVTVRLRDFVNAFFLPIFFTNTGLRTDINSLPGGTMWVVCGAVVAAAVVGKLGGCAVAARLTGSSWRESLLIGAMMNTRGLMELIVINVGYDLGVIPRSLFCMLVLMAVITTMMTTPIVLWLRRGTELEEPIARSGFLGGPLPPQAAETRDRVDEECPTGGEPDERVTKRIARDRF